MGIYDRDYVRAKRRPPEGGGPYWQGRNPLDRVRPWRVNTWIIAINVAVFLIGALALGGIGVVERFDTRVNAEDIGDAGVDVVTQYPLPDDKVADYRVAAPLKGGGYALGQPVDPDADLRPGLFLGRDIVNAETGEMVGVEVFRVMDPVTAFFHFSTAKAFFWYDGVLNKTNLGLEVWRLITFQFVHAGMFHLLFNMIGLYFFGPRVEEQLGSKRYAAFYLMCGIAGGLLYLILNLIGSTLHIRIPGALFETPAMPLIGASAGVFGVIMARAFIDPHMLVRMLIPPVTLRMRTLAYLFVGIAATNLLFGNWLPFFGENQGGDAAHLGGAIAGWFFVRNAHLLREFFDVFGNSKLPESERRAAKRTRRRTPESIKGEDLDKILQKIREKGTDSLTAREKRLLQQETEKRQD